jgi:hypothetical protein
MRGEPSRDKSDPTATNPCRFSPPMPAEWGPPQRAAQARLDKDENKGAGNG